MRGTVLPVYQPHYAQGAAIFVLFLAVVLLNALADRFWCRYLCPLGALLGLVSKVQVLRPLAGSTLRRLRQLRPRLPLDAIEAARGARVRSGGRRAARPPAAPATPRVVTSECTMCLDCLVACRRDAGMTLGVTRRPGPWVPAYDPGRREFVAAAALGVGAVALFGTGVRAR